jgi:hypothetical protein
MRALIFFRRAFWGGFLGFVIVSGFVPSIVRAQTGAHEPSPGPMGASQMYSLIDPYWKANTTKAATAWQSLSGVSGSMFYNDDWAEGYVLLQNQKRTPTLLLRYNIYSNEIYFRQDSEVMVIDPSLPVREFGMSVSFASGNRDIVFRNGYPATNRNSTATFYQVVRAGELSVLKHYTKRVTERNNMTTGPEKVINDTEDWYLFDSTSHQIMPFKPSKNGVMESLPRYAEQMRVIIKERGLKLKEDADWVILFDELTVFAKNKNPASN